MAVCLVGFYGDELLNRKKKKKMWSTDRKLKAAKITRSRHSDSELKVAHKLLFEFLRRRRFIFSEHMLLKCRIISRPKTFHLSAFHRFCACADLNWPSGRWKASRSTE